MSRSNKPGSRLSVLSTSVLVLSTSVLHLSLDTGSLAVRTQPPEQIGSAKSVLVHLPSFIHLPSFKADSAARPALATVSLSQENPPRVVTAYRVRCVATYTVTSRSHLRPVRTRNKSSHSITVSVASSTQLSTHARHGKSHTHTHTYSTVCFAA